MDSFRSSIHIIAEAGTNHGGDPAVAKMLIDHAKNAGADSVKFQIIYPDGLYLPQIWENGRVTDNEVYALREAARLSESAYDELFAYARKAQIPLSASVFDDRGLALLEKANPPYVKIASCDLNNYPFLRRVGQVKRKVILSTGMATIREIDLAVEAITAAGNDDLVVMHCVSVYPVGTEAMELHTVVDLIKRYGFPVGLSDHSETSLAAAMAVTEGVTWIEKHFTLDRRSEGFDHAYALEPNELERYIEDIRTCEKALTSKGELSQAEADVRRRARRGLYAARDLEGGITLAEGDILVVRPEGPLSPADIDWVIGRRLVRPLRRYQALTPSLVAND